MRKGNFLIGGGILFVAFLAVWACNRPAPAPTVPPAQTLPELTPASAVPFKDIAVAAQDRRIPVIMYHNVIAKREATSQWFDVTLEELQKQLEWMTTNGWQPITLDAFYKHLSEGATVPEKSILLTFDDNYQGFFDNAYPLLKERRIPASMFVHTGFVGNKQNTPKMGWDELKTLAKDGLVQIGSHTVTHPDDITQLYTDQQTKELAESKQVLEKELGIKVEYLAYPDGKNDSMTQLIARQSGYKMAFSTESGPAEESPNIMCVNRYVSTKLETACEEAQKAALGAPAAVVQVPLTDQPIQIMDGVFGNRKLTMIAGGVPKTWLAAGRFPVGQIITMAGAKAGINGGYFALSAITSDDDQMIGPCLASNQKIFKADRYEPRLPKLKNRPLVMIGPTKLVIAPFQPGTMDTEEQVRAFLPDATDVFMAGAWFVHNGEARKWDEMKSYVAADVKDFRRRAFFGVMKDGRVVIGAAIDSVTTEQLGEALVAAGAQEAVLLDSGFSTSLVYGDQVLASGHATPDKPSRPVPHTILLFSEKTPPTENGPILQSIVGQRRTAGQGGTNHRRRHRRA